MAAHGDQRGREIITLEVLKAARKTIEGISNYTVMAQLDGSNPCPVAAVKWGLDGAIIKATGATNVLGIC